ncbi:MAG: HlyC/CorC family transporter [Clostridiales bacterium]|nr:HlyC/CorC family transporter [Clostridiales bacterium]
MSIDSWPRYLYILLILIIMIFNALTVASKRSLDYVDRKFVKDSIENDPHNAVLRTVSAFLAKPSKYHYADYAASIIYLLMSFSLFNLWIYRQLKSLPLILLANLGFYIVYMSFSDILPKKLAAQSNERDSLSLVKYQRFIYYITLPIVTICKTIADIVLKILGKETDVDDTYFSEEKVMSLLERGQETGEIKEEGRKMIYSIFAFDDLLAYEIMTPRTDVFMFDIQDDREEYLEELMQLKHSRIPIYNGDPDNIVGILHIKDYLRSAVSLGFDVVDISQLLRPAYFVPETKNIDSLFMELQRENQHIAILIDEYGGFSGIVSIEDIIEQIVGDIDDEFDEKGRIIEKINDDTYIVDGNVYLDDLEEETNVNLESDSSETIGGFIIDLMGEIPRENIKYNPIHFENIDFTILEVRDRRIAKVAVKINQKEDE